MTVIFLPINKIVHCFDLSIKWSHFRLINKMVHKYVRPLNKRRHIFDLVKKESQCPSGRLLQYLDSMMRENSGAVLMTAVSGKMSLYEGKVVPGACLTLNFCKSDVKKMKNSFSANDCPRQTRLPMPKGITRSTPEKFPSRNKNQLHQR